MKYVNNITLLMDHSRHAFLLVLRILTFFSLLFLSFYASAQVNVTPATGGESICLNSGPTTSDYYNLSDITILETNPLEMVSEVAAKTFILGF